MTRWYATPAESVSRIAASVLLGREFTIARDEHDARGGEIEAQRREQSARVLVRGFPNGGCRVSVTLEHPDPSLGRTILDDIAARIGSEGDHPTAVRASLEDFYPGTLSEMLACALRSLASQGLFLLERDVLFDEARLTARSETGLLVDIYITRRASSARVHFSTVAETREEAERLTWETKLAFERCLERR